MESHSLSLLETYDENTMGVVYVGEGDVNKVKGSKLD